MNYIDTYFKPGKFVFAIAFACLWSLNLTAQDQLTRHYKEYKMSLKANGADRRARAEHKS